MKKKRLVTLSLSILIIGAVVAAFIAMKNAPAQTGAWQQSPPISGTGRQDTTEFVMNNQWRIIWTIQNQTTNLFLVAVYAKNGTGYSPIADADESDTNATQGILPVDYTGRFIIRVVTSDDTEWTLHIQEFVKPT